ncbi:helix-turn-helix domain-containing protein [Pseudonocardia phyllosphaerae]|uniref:helix-turn-helix domain-containing protein n=1 Tax=Pseudonocardia phyllosphaerae TaxID=3390502 RepID=UPI00397E1C01
MSELTPIAEVAVHFDLPLSTLRFWEDRGLVTSHRRGGRRCYDRDQLYRIASIQQWRDTGLLSIEQIRELVATRQGTAIWLRTADEAIEVVDQQLERLEKARDYLVHLRGCPYRGNGICPGFRATVSLPPSVQAGDHV